jgi:uroporphyrin-III C-methyltransferase/precorrin-2 dehydrogenase/sirohydrochlorin ferrochelatase
VSLVGAGPGDPDLLTVRAHDRLRAATLVLHDGLVPEAVVDVARSAERVSVARRAGPKTLSQDVVIDLMVDAAWRGERVVRLKGGDPFVFGRGGEEMQGLSAAGVPFEVVPGLSSALAAPALAGIPVTHRGAASGFVVLSGHAPEAYAPLLGTITPRSVTVVVLMGIGERRAIARCLLEAGWPGETPAAIVVNASRPRQRVWVGRVNTLGINDDFGARDDPGVIVVGDVVACASAADILRAGMGEEQIWQPTTIQGH